MPTQILSGDVSGLQDVGQCATHIADQIIKTSNTAHTTVHDGLAWHGEARRAAEWRADREQAQMRAVATAYDDLGSACIGADSAMQFPLSEIKTILAHYVVAPVAVADDWTVIGVDDWSSESGVQLQRLGGLVESLAAADAEWGAKIAAANAELDSMAPSMSWGLRTLQSSRTNPWTTVPTRIACAHQLPHSSRSSDIPPSARQIGRPQKR